MILRLPLLLFDRHHYITHRRPVVPLPGHRRRHALRSCHLRLLRPPPTTVPTKPLLVSRFRYSSNTSPRTPLRAFALAAAPQYLIGFSNRSMMNFREYLQSHRLRTQSALYGLRYAASVLLGLVYMPFTFVTSSWAMVDGASEPSPLPASAS